MTEEAPAAPPEDTAEAKAGCAISAAWYMSSNAPYIKGYVYAYVGTYVSMKNTCMHVYIHNCIHTCVHASMRSCIHSSIHMYFTQAHIYICIYIYIYIYPSLSLILLEVRPATLRQPMRKEELFPCLSGPLSVCRQRSLRCPRARNVSVTERGSRMRTALAHA